MTAATYLNLLPLLLLLACESKPAVRATPATKSTVAAAALAPTTSHPVTGKALQTFTWEDDVCLNTGTYPAGAYTQRQLRDTYQVVRGFGLLPTTTAFSFKDYNDAYFKHAAAGFQDEYDSIAAALRGLQVVPSPFWQKMKHLRELELAEQYAMGQAELKGYFQPASLLHASYYSHCAAYAEALASTDTATVLRAWRKLVDEEKATNGAPQYLENEYVQAAALPTGIQYAKMKLMTFGWGNCANGLSKYNGLEDQYRLTTKFEQLFKQVKHSDCADVD